MPIARLDPAERDAALGALPGWTLADDGLSIVRQFAFADFAEAFAFMTRVAAAAEAADHHPDWHNVWNRVDITLTTHEAGGLTTRDLDLARVVDGLVQR